MKFHCPHFRSGVALTCFIAVLAISLSHFPGLNQIGVLALALALGMVFRVLLHIPEEQETGIRFSAKELLRLGTVLVGVKCNFALLAQVGPRMVVVVGSVVIGGLLFITWLGRIAGLSETLSLLLAIDTSICGGSAVASVAPILQATKEEIALAIPLGSLMGTLALLGMEGIAHFFQVSPVSFGIFAGASLQEVSQVIAVVSVLPDSIESGIATKFLRILFLAPAMLGIGFFLMKRGSSFVGTTREGLYAFVNATWFVFGFLLVGMLYTTMKRWGDFFLITHIEQSILSISTFLMAAAMVGVGLQIRVKSLWEQGWRAVVVISFGWLFLAFVALNEIYFLHLK